MIRKSISFLIIVGLSFCQIVYSDTLLGAGQQLVMNTPPEIYKPTEYIYSQDTDKGGRALGEEKLVNWIKSNISRNTGLSLSFNMSKDRKKDIYSTIGKKDCVKGIIERTIIEEGLVIYDGAVAQIALTMLGGKENLKQARHPLDVYWKGKVGRSSNIRAGRGFIYDPENPQSISGDLGKKGERGFIFRIINANGRYNMEDPLDGKTYFENFPNWPTIHWEDWKPVAGENAWVTIAAMQLYHKKYYDDKTQNYKIVPESVEYKLAEELARAALLMKAESGGIRMAPIGTYRNPKDFVDPNQKQGTWWYNQISTENNISWYAAFRMLYQVTKKEVYKEAMDDIASYFKQVFSYEDRFFYQGMNFQKGAWVANKEHFALDVQTWMIATVGPETIDEWFGPGMSYELWKTAKQHSGYFSDDDLLGVGYTYEHDQISVEWTAGAILATQLLAKHYESRRPDIVHETTNDMNTMRGGIESLRTELSSNKAAYSYSLKRKYIPFGWYSHSPDVLSLASTAWVVMIDNNYNPFVFQI